MARLKSSRTALSTANCYIQWVFHQNNTHSVVYRTYQNREIFILSDQMVYISCWYFNRHRYLDLSSWNSNLKVGFTTWSIYCVLCFANHLSTIQTSVICISLTICRGASLAQALCLGSLFCPTDRKPIVTELCVKSPNALNHTWRKKAYCRCRWEK